MSLLSWINKAHEITYYCFKDERISQKFILREQVDGKKRKNMKRKPNEKGKEKNKLTSNLRY
jgi:hypothetical protein